VGICRVRAAQDADHLPCWFTHGPPLWPPVVGQITTSPSLGSSRSHRRRPPPHPVLTYTLPTLLLAPPPFIPDAAVVASWTCSNLMHTYPRGKVHAPVQALPGPEQPPPRLGCTPGCGPARPARTCP
jgi:hypothetical protein